VLGVFNDLAAISQIVHRYGTRLLVDAAQLVAHRKINMELTNIDYLVFSAHKMYAPFGSSALVAKKNLLHFSPENKEAIKQAGEENVGGIAALGKAFVLLQRICMDVIREEEKFLTRRLLLGLKQIQGLRIVGIKDTDSHEFIHKGDVIVFSHSNIISYKFARKLAEQGGIGIRYGCHCSHLLIKHILHVSPFLEQLQRIIVTLFHSVELPGLARVSIGLQNRQEEIDRFIQELDSIIRRSKTEREAHSNNTPVFSFEEVRKQINEFVRDQARKVFAQP
jgi:selenocysteine lyase/cysteine desulfurase